MGLGNCQNVLIPIKSEILSHGKITAKTSWMNTKQLLLWFSAVPLSYWEPKKQARKFSVALERACSRSLMQLARAPSVPLLRSLSWRKRVRVKAGSHAESKTERSWELGGQSGGPPAALFSAKRPELPAEQARKTIIQMREDIKGTRV